MFTTVSEFARHILESGSLPEKLRAPKRSNGGPLEFSEPKELFISLPARDDVLKMREGNERLPKLKELKDRHARAFSLERFCGHELQAIELFAWALLAFPKAPLALRRGFLAALVEEQAHLSLYRERLFAHDSDLGQHPLSNYFWKLMPAVMQHAQPEHAFLATVGLTLEQANLDFSLLYRDAFAEVGDEESAKVMHQVHLDEIGHVRLAAVWLPKRMHGNLSLAEAYRRSIPFPLSAARAKARRFDVKARKEAGLDDDMIEFVRQARPYERAPATLERQTRLHIRANFGAEENRGGIPQSVVEATATLRAAFAHLFASEHRISHDLEQGDNVATGDVKRKTKATPIHECFRPPFATPAFPFLPSTGQVAWWSNHEDDRAPPFALLEEVHDKAFSASFVVDNFAHQHLVHVLGPKECAPENIRALILTWPSWAQKRARLKPRFSSSGRGHIIVDETLLSKKNQRRLESTARKAGMILEPEFHLLQELSAQFFVEKSGNIHCLGTTKQQLSPRGAPVGNQGFVQNVDGEVSVHSGHFFDDEFRTTCFDLVKAAQNKGFFGPCGIDGFVYKSPDDDEPQLRAISELNARFTTGWVAIGVLQRAIDVLKSEGENMSVTHDWTFSYVVADEVSQIDDDKRFFSVGKGGLWLGVVTIPTDA
ncbi:MAG: ferritin-like domain-containing protein [Deltaproteobacteria bacterium]|nr:ferritin-like domain-containing protein [Deltaproteobacteria bacterium]